MAIPLRIVFRGFSRSPALEESIRSEVERLGRLSDRIESCRVRVELLQPGHHANQRFSVHLELAVPGPDIIAESSADDAYAPNDVRAAMKTAFAVAARQLEERARATRDAHRRHAATG